MATKPVSEMTDREIQEAILENQRSQLKSAKNTNMHLSSMRGKLNFIFFVVLLGFILAIIEMFGSFLG